MNLGKPFRFIYAYSINSDILRRFKISEELFDLFGEPMFIYMGIEREVMVLVITNNTDYKVN